MSKSRKITHVIILIATFNRARKTHFNTKMSNSSVRNIFEKMETTNVPEDLTEAELWLQKTDLKLPTTNEEVKETIDNCLNGMKVFCELGTKTKMQLLNKLADEVEKHSTLLCQLELKQRHILIKDSKNKTVPMFIDYLKYYAQWSCTIYDHCPEYEPLGLCGVVFAPDTTLPIIGANIGAALAAGNGLICQIDSDMCSLARFLMELFKNVGFPKGTISFVENLLGNNIHDHRIAKCTFVDNLRAYNYIYHRFIQFRRKLALLRLGKTAAIIFENADQDSACDKLLDCAWSCKGMFPFGIKELFVQESIFEEFVDKIKSKILKLNVAYREDCNQNKTSDILINDTSYKKEEIERLNKIPLQIGYKTFGNTRSKDETSDNLYILAFRTAAEAVTLVNNNKFGSGVSIWSDNISLCNELTRNIKASILWINTHGIISPNAAFCPVKCGGSSYIGGKEGLLEYMKPKEIYQLYNMENLNTIVNKKNIHTCVESAKKAHETWCKYSPTTRSQCLLKLAELSSSIEAKFPTYAFDKFWSKPLQYWSVICNNMKNIIQLQGNVELKIFKEPVGVVFINIDTVTDFETIIVALAYGNAVIITNTCPELDSFFKELIEIIPKTGIPAGLFSVIFKSNSSIINSILSHQDVKKVLYMPGELDNIKVKSRENIIKAVTYNKCIWTTLGETLL